MLNKIQLCLFIGCLSIASLTTASIAPVPIPAPSGVDAKAYLLMDFNTQQVLAERNADKQIEPASITKIMTAYVVFDALKQGHISLTDAVKISAKAWRNPEVSGWTQGSRMFALVDTEVPLESVLRGLIVQSGNDAAIALAEHVAESEEKFVDLMNEYAQSMSLNGTHFVNCTGWPMENHYSTAKDLAILSIRLIADFPEYYRFFSEKSFTFNNITQQNRNVLLWQDASIDGVKTGHTQKGGYSLAVSAQRHEMRLVAVLIGSRNNQSRSQSGSQLLNYGFHFYETNRLYDANELLREQRVTRSDNTLLRLGLEEAWYITIPRDSYERLEIKMDVQKEIMAPVSLHQSFGRVYASVDGKVLAEKPLVALNAVNKGNFFQRILGWLRGVFE